MNESPQSMNHILDPPETLSQRALHLALHGIGLIADNPLLPLQFRIIEAPSLGARGNPALAFLHFPILRVEIHVGLWRLEV